jgi:23S rRNA pseudouridine1911/1915/1917 synthase
VEEAITKERLDQYVAREVNLSRKASVDLIKSGAVQVNGKAATKPSLKIEAEDKVKIAKAAFTLPKLEQIDLPVIYEDENVVVINKPIGVLTHSKGAYNPEPTVTTWLETKVPGMKGNRAGIVHRLDRATSGVMILAKNPETLLLLQKQFSQRKTKKIYSAVIIGVPSEPQAVIDMPIERNPKKPQTFRVGINGKSATTGYSLIKTNDKLSLLELRPVTGRTHQLRVHLKQIGHPIVGDTLYGGKEADRLYLHAKSLEITLPGGDRRVFSAETPTSFEEKVLYD